MPGQRSVDDQGHEPIDYASTAGSERSQYVRGEVLEDARRQSWLEQAWLGVPAGWRRTGKVAGALSVCAALALTGLDQVREWLAEREQRQVVDVGLSLRVSASSSTPVGGHVTYFVVLHNAGAQSLAVTSVRASGDRLVLRGRDTETRGVAPGRDVFVPMSALLTCSPQGSGEASRGLTADVGVRGADGSLRTKRTSVADSIRIVEVADTLCSVRPDLTDYELSGPVIRPTSPEGG